MSAVLSRRESGNLFNPFSSSRRFASPLESPCSLDFSISNTSKGDFVCQFVSVAEPIHFIIHNTQLVPGERIELSWIAPHDFESCASTNSAIPAGDEQFTIYNKLSYVTINSCLDSIMIPFSG